jgi:hypothetical protein
MIFQSALNFAILGCFYMSLASAQTPDFLAFQTTEADQKILHNRIVELQSELNVLDGTDTINPNLSEARRNHWMARLCLSKNNADAVAARYLQGYKNTPCPSESSTDFMTAEFSRSAQAIKAEMHKLVLAKSVLQFRELYEQAKASNMQPKILRRFLEKRLDRDDWPDEILPILTKYQKQLDDASTEGCAACAAAQNNDPLSVLARLNGELAQTLARD